MDRPETICPGCRRGDPDCAWTDLGIGYYEYWGIPGFDSYEVYLTTCCEAEPEEFWPEPAEEEIYAV